MGYQHEEYSTTRLDYRVATNSSEKTINWTAGARVEVRLCPLHRCAGSGCAAWAGSQRSHSLELRGLASLGLRVQSVECSAAGTTGATIREVVSSGSDNTPIKLSAAAPAPAEIVTLPGRWGLDDEVVARLWLACAPLT